MNRLYILINFLRHLNLNKLSFVFIFAAAYFYGCGNDSPPSDYAARVNDSYLTEEELSFISDTSHQNFYKSEIIRNWIHRELLYQEALKKGIIKKDNFKKILEDSEKQLAASFLLNEIADNAALKFDKREAEDFFNKNIEEFKLSDNFYLLNYVELNSEEKAVEFRNSVFEIGWENSLNKFRPDDALIDENYLRLTSEAELHPVELLRVVKELYPSEISIVLNNEEGKFTIVQLIERHDYGTIPPFDIIQPLVEKRLKAKKRENFLRDYVKELYSKNEIEVKKGVK
jgi:hypothetical protein